MQGTGGCMLAGSCLIRRTARTTRFARPRRAKRVVLAVLLMRQLPASMQPPVPCIDRSRNRVRCRKTMHKILFLEGETFCVALSCWLQVQSPARACGARFMGLARIPNPSQARLRRVKDVSGCVGNAD